MTPSQRHQLELLAEEQRRLASTLQEFGARLDAFAADLKASPTPLEAEPAPKAAAELPVIPPTLPPPPPLAPPPLPPTTARTTSTTPPPPELPETTRPPVVPAVSVAAPPPLPPAPLLSPPVAPPAPAEPASLEMQIGTVWLARIGIVILVTGLVFLGNYARQFIVAHLGPAGKVTLLFTSAALLGGIGLWLERRATTRRFAQVLIAGGAAMVYYTTYAAHFVPRLRIIQNPLLAGLLLLAVAAIFIWWSDRRRLQTAALLAIGLSYYTAAINPIGTFTLYSSLVLTAAAGFLLIRNGWALISWVSLAGTYASFAFWRFHQAVTHAVPDINQPWNAQVLLLAGYWTLFTAPVFLAPERTFPYYRRSAFLTLNNALFFWLASEHLSRTNPDGFWGFCLVFGAVLLALSALASRRRPEASVFDGAYLVQGLAAVTAGFAAKLTGNSLAITLAAESVVLLTGVNRRHGAIYQVAAAIVAVWAFILSLPGTVTAGPVIDPAAAGVAALFLLSAWWLKQRLRLPSSMAWSFRAAGFVLLAVVLLSLVLMHHARAPWQPAALALAAVLSAASVYFLRLPELALLGQTFLGVAFAMWIPADLGFAPFTPWWQPLPLVLVALAMCHWWPNQRALWAGRIELETLHLASALVAIVVSFFWLGGSVHGAAWIVCTAAVGTATVAYGLLTGAWAVSLFGQLFAYVSLASLLPWAAPLSGWVDLAPVLAAAATTAIFHFAPAKRWPAPIRPALPTAVLVYWVLTSLLAVAWIFAHVQTDWRPLTFVGIGILLALLRTSSQAILPTALAFLALGYLTFILRYPGPPVWQDLLAILLAPATLRIRRRLAPDSTAAPPELAIVSSAATTAAVWHWLTRGIMSHDRAETLTLAWSGLAVAFFIIGLALRDRIYRRGGLALLALGVGRIILIDVWRLDTIYRIITLLVLGVVLLSLSYVYNRYSDRIKRWL